MLIKVPFLKHKTFKGPKNVFHQSNSMHTTHPGAVEMNEGNYICEGGKHRAEGGGDVCLPFELGNW